MIALTDPDWAEVEDLFDPGGKRGAPPRYPRREMVEAILFLARTGCQWRYLPAHYPPWEAVWQQWRRWCEKSIAPSAALNRVPVKWVTFAVSVSACASATPPIPASSATMTVPIRDSRNVRIGTPP